MRIRTTTFDRLSTDEIAAWSEIQRAHAVFSSPYFRPEFTQMVASVCDNVEVAVLQQSGEPVGFFPFQRARFNVGLPVGTLVNDFQGVIAAPEMELDPRELLCACRLSSWQFNHLAPVHRSFDEHAWTSEDSTYMELSAGLDSYVAARINGNNLNYEYRRKKRRLQREFGFLTFEPHLADPRMLDTCIQWKIEQYRRTQVPNVFRHEWVGRLLHEILRCRTSDFAGRMQACYAGDQIAAINFGIQSGPVFHSWFPGYNQAMSAVSPGFLCWIELIKHAAECGITRVDFGKGSEGYKARLMTGATQVSEGAVYARTSAAIIRRACWSMRKRITTSVLGRPARALSRNVRSVRHLLDAKLSNPGKYT
jgi:CelD/BcsL family acetyltransferase involved in cellulose biosynthesis